MGIGIDEYLGSTVWPFIVPRLFPKHGSLLTLGATQGPDISTKNYQTSVNTRGIQNMRNQVETQTPHPHRVVPGVSGEGEARIRVVIDSPGQQERAKCY